MQLKTCMVVDDDLDDHEIFAIALEESGRSVELQRAYDGIDAIRQLHDQERQLPDFIFMDLNMPKMNGIQCLHAIRSDDLLKHIPVVIYSTSSEIRDLIEAQRFGATAYIVKSPHINELAMALRDLFNEEL
jgi:CheY-like chemotaxis protein